MSNQNISNEHVNINGVDHFPRDGTFWEVILGNIPWIEVTIKTNIIHKKATKKQNKTKQTNKKTHTKYYYITTY